VSLRARRLGRPRNLRSEITIQPHSNTDITIHLPATQNCDNLGALCTPDAKALSTDVTITITGPGS